MPVGRLRERTIAWLDRAFVRGTATNGRLSYRGPVRKFPFRNGEGDFTASADATNVTLDYYPGFAPLANAIGHGEIPQRIDRSGRRERRARRAATVDRPGSGWPTTRRPMLEIDGKAGGDLQQALAYVQASPLGPIIGEQFMGLTGSGPAQYQVKLSLPVIAAEVLAAMPAPPPPRDYTVRATLDGVTVALPALRAPAQRVEGTFELHNYEVKIAGLRGTILDGPFELSASPAAPRAMSKRRSNSRPRAARVAPGCPHSSACRRRITMSGATDWELQGHIEKRRAGGAWPLQFDVASNLGRTRHPGAPSLSPRPRPRRGRRACGSSCPVRA